VIHDERDSGGVLLAQMLGSAGHEVETAVDGVEARLWLIMAEFALVILEVGMPGHSGQDLARWIRDRDADVAVLMATGANDPRIAGIVLDTGAYGCLFKPFERTDVAIDIAPVLRVRRLEIERRRRGHGSARILRSGDSA
jgi:DNA-binding NtrC family response regulator